jgi:hypothetical protein
MTNVKHSAEKDDWHSPTDLIERCRRTLGEIDFDPASDALANLRVRARWYFDRHDNGLTVPWPPLQRVFLNAPGGKIKNRSIPGLFWKRLMEYRDSGLLVGACVIGFSLEQLSVSQKYATLGMADFPHCIPRDRINFIDSAHPDKEQATHANAITYVPGTEDRTEQFWAEFYDLGSMVI